MTYGFRLRGTIVCTERAGVPFPPVVMRKFAGGSSVPAMGAGLVALRHAVTLRTPKSDMQSHAAIVPLVFPASYPYPSCATRHARNRRAANHRFTGTMVPGRFLMIRHGERCRRCSSREAQRSGPQAGEDLMTEVRGWRASESRDYLMWSP